MHFADIVTQLPAESVSCGELNKEYSSTGVAWQKLCARIRDIGADFSTRGFGVAHKFSL